MKILLVGEYSRLHNSLKEGLIKLNHDVTIVAAYDGFKKYEVDLLIRKKYQTIILKKFKNLIYRISGIDIQSISIKKQIKALEPKLSGFDIVQFINEAPFGCLAKVEMEIFDFIRERNKKIFLLSCGTDYISVNFANDDKFRYSILTPYKNGKDRKYFHSYGLKFLQTDYKLLHEHIYNHTEGVIASDIDYHIPLKNHQKYLGLIPNPINTDILKFEEPETKGKIIIFHGINSNNYFKKGNDIFEEALDIVTEKHPEKVKVITVRSLPYNEYIKALDKAHILLDQIYAYDQGYNALEAMAKGKVVLTGAEKEWLAYYNIKEDTIAINALPDAYKIAEKLEWLIENPEKIIEISTNARRFIEEYHNYTSSAKSYLNIWNKDHQ